ncbi:unnamed protein product, partial [Effrenium voratum]
QTNLETCVGILESMRGYDDLRYSVRPFLINSLWYGLPQSRARMYIVGIKHCGVNMNPEDFLDTVQTYLSHLQFSPPDPAARLPSSLWIVLGQLPLSGDSLLLPDASSQVVTELQRLQEVRRSSGVTTGTHEKSQAWELTSSPWYEVLPARMREVLAFAELDRQKKDFAYADIYHSAYRYSTGPQRHTP